MVRLRIDGEDLRTTWCPRASATGHLLGLVDGIIDTLLDFFAMFLHVVLNAIHFRPKLP